MAKVERKMDVAINKTYANNGELDEDGNPARRKLFLDELNPTAGRYETEPSINCGLFCGELMGD